MKHHLQKNVCRERGHVGQDERNRLQTEYTEIVSIPSSDEGDVKSSAEQLITRWTWRHLGYLKLRKNGRIFAP